MTMAQTAAPERSNPLFVRYNYERPAPTPEPADPGVNTPERSLKVAVDELLSVIERAVGRIEQGESTALREIWTALRELQAMVARDPGISMAAEDLYAAAAALVAGQSTEAERADVRRWRLLKEADARLRDRLGSAQPSEKAKLLGLN